MAGESEAPDQTHPTEYARCRTHAATAHVAPMSGGRHMRPGR
jgi:hypothetical protein